GPRPERPPSPARRVGPSLDPVSRVPPDGAGAATRRGHPVRGLEVVGARAADGGEGPGGLGRGTVGPPVAPRRGSVDGRRGRPARARRPRRGLRRRLPPPPPRLVAAGRRAAGLRRADARAAGAVPGAARPRSAPAG